MGLTVQLILVNTKSEKVIENEELLRKLDIISYEKMDDQPFEMAMNEFGAIYIGRYEGNILIMDSDLIVSAFNSENLSFPEQQLVNLFPTSEMFFCCLISSMNYFAFSIIKNGKKIRVKSGAADSGTTIDVGEPLEEEKELLSKSEVDNTNKRIYRLDSDSDKVFSEHQVGENFVFEIFKRYTGGKTLMNEGLLETIFSGYTRN